MEEANKLLVLGKEHLMMGRAAEAVKVLREACGLLSRTFGELADECGEAFLWGGKALLELAREENSVLSSDLEGAVEEAEAEDNDKAKDEKARDEGLQGGDQEEQKLAEEVEGKSRAGDGDDVKGKSEEDVADKTVIDGEEESDDDTIILDEEEPPEKESEEEVGNLELAWEMLEVAKLIYQRKQTKESQLMAAQAYLKLGEASAESGNFTQAKEDFKECLKLQLKLLDYDSRILAETHYHLGMAYRVNLHYNLAITEFNNAISVINSRLENIQELIDEAEEPEVLPEEKKEMDELKALLPKIQAELEDATEALKSSKASEAVPDLKGGPSTSSGFCSEPAGQAGTSSSGQSVTSAVSGTSHLVRTKRMSDETLVKDLVDKKVKQDEGQVNRGEELPADQENGDKNGHTNMTEVERQ